MTIDEDRARGLKWMWRKGWWRKGWMEPPSSESKPFPLRSRSLQFVIWGVCFFFFTICFWIFEAVDDDSSPILAFCLMMGSLMGTAKLFHELFVHTMLCLHAIVKNGQ